jgi:hypothetical protein
MGIGGRVVKLLVYLKEQDAIPDHASVIDIGAQQLANSTLRARIHVEKLGRLFGTQSIPPLPVPPPPMSDPLGQEPLSPNAPLASELWRWLGCSYASIDIDGSPDAIALDLNFDNPDNLAGKHDVVTNCGTTEHIANQLNAFKVIHDLTAPGGVMIHNVPSQGGFNHGLINYTPKFFWSLARSNNYRWLWFDFLVTSAANPIPENVIESVQPFRPEVVDIAKTYRVAECSITAAFMKQGQSSYVAPIDIADDAVTENENLVERYWSVLKRPG